MNVVKRKSIRFDPDSNTLINIKVGTEVVVGLAFSESMSGFGGVFIKNNNSTRLLEHIFYDVSIGNVENISAEVVWIKELDEQILKIGFKIKE